MSYRRFSTRTENTEQPVREGKNKYYTRNPEDLERMTGIPFPFPKENYRDGVTFRPKATEPTLNVRNYTHDVPMDSRTTCFTCGRGGQPKDLKDGLYRCWCRRAMEWKQEPHVLKDNGCRDWLPRNQDCIG